MENRAVVERLKEFGATRGSSDWSAWDCETERLVRTNAFAFLIAVAFDRGMPWQKAWRIPVEIDKAGCLDPARLASMNEPDLIKLVDGLAIRPRYGARQGVPYARAAHALPVAEVAEPVGRRRIRRRLAIAAQQGDRVALDQSTLARRARLVFDAQPKERHVADVAAYAHLEVGPRQFDVRPVESQPPRHRTRIPADALRGRQSDALLACQRDSNEQAEDRAPMVAAAARCAAMLRQPSPQRASAPGGQAMGSYAYDP